MESTIGKDSLNESYQKHNEDSSSVGAGLEKEWWRLGWWAGLLGMVLTSDVESHCPSLCVGSTRYTQLASGKSRFRWGFPT